LAAGAAFTAAGLIMGAARLREAVAVKPRSRVASWAGWLLACELAAFGIFLLSHLKGGRP
jgi:hypothetical protein